MTKRQSVQVFVKLLLVIFCITGALWWFDFALGKLRNRSFEQHGWKNGSTKQRATMAQDLVKNVIRPGMLTNEIIRLLGAPEEIISEYDIRDNYLRGDMIYSWWLGGGTWVNSKWDDMYLYVSFSSNRGVVHAELNGF